MLEQMYDSDAREAVRGRNGCVAIYNPGDKFKTFPEERETRIGDPMHELGFL